MPHICGARRERVKETSSCHTRVSAKLCFESIHIFSYQKWLFFNNFLIVLYDGGSGAIFRPNCICTLTIDVEEREILRDLKIPIFWEACLPSGEESSKQKYRLVFGDNYLQTWPLYSLKYSAFPFPRGVFALARGVYRGKNLVVVVVVVSTGK